jgi:hypothetical protein
VFLLGFIDSGSPPACKSGKINKPSSVSMAAEHGCFCLDLLIRAPRFARKSGKINKPSSLSIEAETPCFCLVLLIRAAHWRVSLEKSTNPTGPGWLGG